MWAVVGDHHATNAELKTLVVIKVVEWCAGIGVSWVLLQHVFKE